MNNSKALQAFLFGAAAGLVAGILLAPRKGGHTREKIRDFINDEKERLNDILDEVRDGYDDVKEKIAPKRAKSK